MSESMGGLSEGDWRNVRVRDNLSLKRKISLSPISLILNNIRMLRNISPLLKISLYTLLLGVLLWACKKDKDITDPKPPEEIEKVVPGETVGLGSEFLDPAEYEKIPLIREPLIRENAAGRLQKDAVLAKTYDLSSKMPPVGNQGQQASCTGWATAYAARSYFHKIVANQNYLDNTGKRDDAAVFSPAFVYNQINKGRDGGAFTSDAIAFIKNTGVCTWADMPYTAKDYLTQPDDQQKQKAAAYKIKDWGRINVTESTFKKFLYFDYPIIISSSLDQNFYNLTHKDEKGEYIWKEQSTVKGGHAMVIVGYDDDRKAFKVQNSWGTSWANKGFIWIAYELIPKVVREAYIMVIDDSNILTLPKVETGEAKVNPDGKIDFSGAITSLGDAPVTGLGICISDSRSELPVIPNYIYIEEVQRTPYPFTFTTQLAADTLWYRAFAQTVSDIIYGDTKYIVVGNKGSNSGVDRDMLLIQDSSGDVYALNPGDGSLIWSGTRLKYSELAAPRGGVVAGSTFAIQRGNGGRLEGFDIKDGKHKWSSAEPITTVPIAIDGLIVYQSYNSVYGMDAASGIVKWSIDAKGLAEGNFNGLSAGLRLTKDGRIAFVGRWDSRTRIFFIGNPQTGSAIGEFVNEEAGALFSGSPRFSDNFMVTHSDEANSSTYLKAYSLNPSRKLLWKVEKPFNDRFMVVNNMIVYDLSTRFEARSTNDGKKLWEYQASGMEIHSGQWSASGSYACLLLMEKTGVFMGENTYLHVINLNTGKLVWKKQIKASVLMKPLVAGSKVYAFDDGQIAAFDITNGNQVWKKTISFRNSFDTMENMCLATKDGKAYYIPDSGMN